MPTAYASTDDVLTLMPKLQFGPTSAITPTQIEQFIYQTEAEIDGILIAQEYPTVPIPDTAEHERSINLLRHYVSIKTAEKVFLILFEPRLAPDHVRAWGTDYDRFIDRLRKGEQRLPTMTPQVAQSYSVVGGRVRIINNYSEDDPL